MTDLLAAWVIIGGLFGGIVQVIFSIQDTDEFSYNIAFGFVSHFYKTYSEEINRAGIIVAIVFISVLIFPGTLLILILVTLNKLFSALWEAFKFVFRKRRKRTGDEVG